MTLRLTAEFRRWSRWYPARWRRDNGAAMLGAYLDQAEGEGRDRLTWAEKAALAAGGVAARLDLVVPARVRDLTATAMVSLLGAFGLIAGILLEWAPGNPGMPIAGRAVPGTGIAVEFATDGFESRAFGPFVSPFVIVCALGVLAWALAMVGPERLYRWSLVATAAAGLAAGANAAPRHAWGWSAQYTEIGLFIALAALIALSAARPREAWRVAAASAVWACALLVPFVHDFGFTSFIQRYRDGSLTSATMLIAPDWVRPVVPGTPPVLTLVIALVLIGALALAVAGRRASAAAAVLGTIPWGGFLVAVTVAGMITAPVLLELGSSSEDIAAARAAERLSIGIDLLVLLLLYAAAVAGAVYFRRRAAARVDDSATPVGR